MAKYWARKDDENEELRTIKPWDENEGKGNMVLPRTPHYDVVAAVIERNGKILCMQKGRTKFEYTQFKWEFPGGKVEKGETPSEAIEREIREELKMDVRADGLIGTTFHQYPDFSISLAAYRCIASDSEPVLTEHISARWELPSHLYLLDWAEADKAIVSMLSPR